MRADTLAGAHAHALADYPREACGLVLVERGREHYVACRNVATTPSEHFILPPEDYAEADDRGEIVGIVHSHPNVPSRPSEADRVGCEASGLPWIIISVMPGAADLPMVADTFEFAPSGYQAPLVGRTFAHGVLDCWALCRDWYQAEMGIDLPNPARADDWWNDGRSDLYSEQALRAAGFEIIGRSGDLHTADWQRGDVITMQIRSRNLVANHAGIYLGDGHILHHLHGRLSSRDVFGGYYLECTRSVARYIRPVRMPGGPGAQVRPGRVQDDGTLSCS